MNSSFSFTFSGNLQQQRTKRCDHYQIWWWDLLSSLYSVCFSFVHWIIDISFDAWIIPWKMQFLSVKRSKELVCCSLNVWSPRTHVHQLSLLFVPLLQCGPFTDPSWSMMNQRNSFLVASLLSKSSPSAGVVLLSFNHNGAVSNSLSKALEESSHACLQWSLGMAPYSMSIK